MGQPFDLDEVVRRWHYGDLFPELLLEIAQSALQAGLDSPSLRELAWRTRPTMAEAGPIFRRALDELGRFSATVEDQPLHFAVQLARQILAGEIGVIAGCRAMHAICALGNLHDDPLFAPFRGVYSETDALPVGSVRKRWSEDALRDADRKIAAAEAHHRDFIATACRALIDRYATTAA